MGCVSFRLHRERRVVWTARDTVFIDGVVWICHSSGRTEWNIRAMEAPRCSVRQRTKRIFSQQCLVNLDAVKGRVAQKCARVDIRVLGIEILQKRQQKPGITDRLVFVRRIGFLVSGNFRVSGKVVFVIELDCACQTKSVSKNTGFIGIAEMTV